MSNITLTTGGGIYCYDSSPLIDTCTINNNQASLAGGGIYLENGSPIIKNCVIESNISGQFQSGNGGGIYIKYSSPTIKNSTVRNNRAYYGGGINCASSSFLCVNCVIANNWSNGYGSGFYSLSSSPSITNCTIADNTALQSGGGIYADSSKIKVVNSILYGDKARGSINEIYLANVSSVTVDYTDIQGNFTGVGNIDSNPSFVDQGSGNYHLKNSSPCIDKGTNDKINYPTLPPDDIDGDSRPQDGDNNGTAEYDMGADEVISQSQCRHNGDVNKDGTITPQDALLAFKQSLGIVIEPPLTQCQLIACDVNNDGKITPADALCIFSKSLGIPSCLD